MTIEKNIYEKLHASKALNKYKACWVFKRGKLEMNVFIQEE